MQQEFKRNIAYKVRIGQILAGKPIMEGEKIKHLECESKQMVRCNIIANVIDKYVQDGEKKFASLTLDDGTGQLKVKTFGDDIEKLTPYNQGDTLLVIGLVRSWNNELYLTPDIVKKKDTTYLLIRKAECEADLPKAADPTQRTALKDTILGKVKEAEKEQGIDIEKLILELKDHPSIINQEIKKLLEEGMIYEPRPGRVRYLG
jgi:DNA polymerase III alpha subunit